MILLANSTIYYCSLAEQLESIKESLDVQSLPSLAKFLECKKVALLLLFVILTFAFYSCVGFSFC